VMYCVVNANSRDEYGFIDEAGFTLTNISSGQSTSFAKPRPTFSGYTVPSPGLTAEWIIEVPVPQEGIESTIGQFGAVYFWGEGYRTNGWVGNAGESEMVTLVSGSFGVQWLVPMRLGSDTFMVQYFPPSSGSGGT
jgi:hypothetical protein